MFNAKLVTCALCENLYNDPRQIPCSHSFCFACISKRLDPGTLTLICPKCDKLHQYKSFDEFQERSMRDGFLSSLVAKHQKSRNRASATSSPSISRPESSLSLTTPTISSTPMLNYSRLFDNSDFELSTPPINNPTAMFLAPPTPESTKMLAKCQSCNQKTLLCVCSHCDNVICGKCRDDHLKNADVELRAQWDSCKNRYESIKDESFRYHCEQQAVIEQSKNLQSLIIQQSQKWIELLQNQKNLLMKTIEENLQACRSNCPTEQLTDSYEFLQKSIEELIKSTDTDPDKVKDLLFEIENFDRLVDSLTKSVDEKELQYPYLTLPENIDFTSIFGSLGFGDFKDNLSVEDPFLAVRTNLTDSLSTTCKSYDDLSENSSTESKAKTSMTSEANSLMSTPLMISKNVPKKKLLWQIEYYAVPYYVCTYGNNLFVCDRYGSLAIYKFPNANDKRQKPVKQDELNLFKELTTASTSDDDRMIVDSFAVHKFWIIVFKRKKNELSGTIYLFSHNGKLISNGKHPHNYPARELTIDTDLNRLWSLDQKQLCLFYYDLPETKVVNPEEFFQRRHLHLQFCKPFAPLHISVNKNVLAVLDKNKQAVHVYDKKTKQPLFEHVNQHRKETHDCWDMALFADSSLLVKLDEASSLKSSSSKHIYLQLDAQDPQKILGIIEETDAYGMMITINDEILIGVRINAKGIIKCYA